MRVLIVDDNELLLEVAKATLSAAGFEVLTSDSAASFSAALATAQPHVALVDVLMPALNGDQLIEVARRQAPRKKDSRVTQKDAPECIFILHSNLPEADLRDLADRCGARGFIRKALRPAELGIQLQDFLRRERLPLPGTPAQLQGSKAR
jgi:CheY-like chemotaxis protein